MKNFKLLFSAAVVSAALMGCSSMAVDDDEAYSENLPSDFSYAQYMAIHPELRYLQIKDFVTSHNSALEVTADAKTADSLAFETNAAQLKSIYTDPYMGGYTEEDYEIDMGVGTKDSLVYTTALRYLSITVVDSSADPVTISKLTVGTWSNETKSYTAIGEVTTDSTGAITKASGNDSTGTLLSFDIGGLISLNKQGTKTRLDTTKVDTIKVPTEGGIPVDKMKKIREFNLYDTEDDYKVISEAPIDTFAISYQYVLFGKLHYWAYRPCTDSEKLKDAILAPSPKDEDWAPATKHYCDDNGQIKEID